VALCKAKVHVSKRLKIPVSQMNHMAVFKLLLRYGAIPDCKDLTGKTIIHYAAGSYAKEDTLKMAEFCMEAAKSSAHFGKDVILRKLSKEEYNGQAGKLGGYLANSGRREVVLKCGKQLSLQPINIFVKQGEIEKCICNEDRKLINDQDRGGMISLHEVLMSPRVDVARFLTKKHKASIDIKCRGNISVRQLSTSQCPPEMSVLIQEYGSRRS